MKTLVVAAHLGGPHINGYDGCHTRWLDGFCSGNGAAAWLNSLGEDEGVFGCGVRAADGHIVTNGEVRANWLRGGSQANHVRALVAEEADLLDAKVRAQKELSLVNRKLYALQACKRAAAMKATTR